MVKIAIVGAGGFGREVKMLIDQINAVNKQYDIIGFYDDAKPKNQVINGLPVLGTIEDINTISEETAVVLGLGNPIYKSKAISIISNPNIFYPTLIHPSVIIGNDEVNIEKGTVICAGTIITCNIKIKSFVTINLACTIGHDSILNDFVSLMPSVNISGECAIQEGVYIGTGAKIINQLEIGKNTVIGAGAVVSKSLPENCTAVGIPAKPIKFHKK
jgi:sugar O-acyltransferase (sialic acid O-acetyltransferase NeuD family)